MQTFLPTALTMATLLLFFLLLPLCQLSAFSWLLPKLPRRRWPFHGLFGNQWGPQHQVVTADQLSASIWLDNTSGSGFKSTELYQNGYFGASIKLQGGYTAGVNNAFYLSNGEEYKGFHDEIDFELLGTIPGEQYTVETNVYMRGNSERNAMDGREVKFHLWFDPTADFHHYAILWNPDQIVFFVDDIPIRQYPRKSDNTFPLSPMWAYGSIWDASSWATDNGKYKVDYRYQPFVANFTNFKVAGCAAQSGSRCGPIQASPSGPGLSPEQLAAMTWARNNYMIYDYCTDPKRDHSLTPEC